MEGVVVLQLVAFVTIMCAMNAFISLSAVSVNNVSVVSKVMLDAAEKDVRKSYVMNVMVHMRVGVMIARRHTALIVET